MFIEPETTRVMKQSSLHNDWFFLFYFISDIYFVAYSLKALTSIGYIITFPLKINLGKGRHNLR